MKDLVAAFFGARRQGKTTQVRQYLAAQQPRRLLIFDPMDEYGAHAGRVDSLKAMLGAARGDRSFALRYVPPRKVVVNVGERDDELINRFDGFCSIALDARRLLMVADELQLVTLPGWSPPSWSECALRGGHDGIGVIGVAQRPALVDKNFFGNCNLVSTCRLNFDSDVATMADVLAVDRARLRALARYHYIGRNMDTGALFDGVTRPPARGQRVAASK